MKNKWAKAFTITISLVMFLVASGCICSGESASQQTQTDSIENTQDDAPPFLTIIQPADNSTTNTQLLSVGGRTNGTKVTVNGANVSVVEGGTFNASVTLVSGLNSITVTATDDASKKTEKVIHVTYIPQSQTTPSQQ